MRRKLVYSGIYSDDFAFNMRDWEKESLKEVFAGTNCIMAITEDGRVLQKNAKSDYETFTENWNQIVQISISKWSSDLVIGLVSDGTCIININAHHEYRSDAYSIATIKNQIKNWTNIVQVAVSDAFFALDSSGHVHLAPLTRLSEKDYSSVLEWENVKKIVTATQCGILGITFDGKVLCSGYNFTAKGPNGDITDYLKSLSPVADIFPVGSECEEILFAFKDGSMRSLREEIPITTALIDYPTPAKVLDGTGAYTVLVLNARKELICWQHGQLKPMIVGEGIVVSYAVGDIEYRNTFVVALVDNYGT